MKTLCGCTNTDNNYYYYKYIINLLLSVIIIVKCVTFLWVLIRTRNNISSITKES